MKIRIRDIISGGIRVERVVMPADIGIQDEEFVVAENPLRVVADLQKVNEFVLAKVAVTFIREDRCARCLECISRTTTVHYAIELEFNHGDEWLDLGARIREEMLMENIPRVLCREDCKGICPGCGTDLNTEPCECKDPQGPNQQE